MYQVVSVAHQMPNSVSDFSTATEHLTVACQRRWCGSPAVQEAAMYHRILLYWVCSLVGACLIPMEATATTVPRSTPRLRQPITQGAVPITRVAVVITRHNPGITHRQRGITNPRRGIIRSRGCTNRHLAITSRHRVTTSRAPITGCIRIRAGTVATVADGTMTTAAMTDATIAAVEATTTEATTTIAVITVAGVAAGDY